MILASMKKNGAILTAFALATTGSVALVQQLTAPRIEAQEKKHLMRTLTQVLPADEYNNELYLDCIESNAPELGPNGPHRIYRAKHNGQPVALLVQHITPEGYSGNIDILTALYANAEIAGVRITQHKETPGLGDKVEVKKSDWVHSFSGVQVQSAEDPRFNVKKEGGMFDQFTGATITPRAVVHSVNTATWYAHQNFDSLFAQPNICQEEQL
ncbi:electron transport complex subunit RsxG [Pseudoalteromonas obscura]|uniref:Ion-translocating oxidoreductase complex subunit G n=1 Tax=Pseudoalteromonas obscura TaxID=3048491 RepID=A0ABT7EIE2_9GAMM|nr:electron transport complex subunit RsxG [Pseudoalteromonas sp. P94(2023)]MDK2594820.1 electron transport complex subunit RsxG [Pseudoalteromonas sp. P94(2023)]